MRKYRCMCISVRWFSITTSTLYTYNRTRNMYIVQHTLLIIKYIIYKYTMGKRPRQPGKRIYSSKVVILSDRRWRAECRSPVKYNSEDVLL